MHAAVPLVPVTEAFDAVAESTVKVPVCPQLGQLGRTFVESQETASGHLRAYFDQPLMFSRFLAAERLLQDGGMDEAKRAEVLGALGSPSSVDGWATTGHRNCRRTGTASLDEPAGVLSRTGKAELNAGPIRPAVEVGVESIDSTSTP
ncbi:hypothetical protein [Streptomyces canus]|uniref:hypothetical protein n=1 Tax=Streptomyces canus TaxID=58343 RepID=UPI0037198BEE